MQVMTTLVYLWTWPLTEGVTEYPLSGYFRVHRSTTKATVLPLVHIYRGGRERCCMQVKRKRTLTYCFEQILYKIFKHSVHVYRPCMLLNVAQISLWFL